MGQFDSALRSYAKVREYCTNAGQIAHLSLELMRISIWIGNYSHVLAFGSRAKSTVSAAMELTSPIYAYCGLANFCLGDYEEALAHFLKVETDTSDGIITKTDISVYISLCALACWDHKRLIQELERNEEFNALSDLDPSLRRCLQAKCNRKYSLLLDTLQQNAQDYSLDMYLAPQLTNLFSLIRERSLLDYLIPYSALPFSKIAVDFHIDENFIEKNLLEIIEAKKLNGKVDSLQKVSIINLLYWSNYKRVYIEPSSEPENFEDIKNIAQTSLLYSKALYLQTLAAMNTENTDDETPVIAQTNITAEDSQN